MTNSLRQAAWGAAAARIMAAGIHAVEPGRAVRESMPRIGNILTVGGQVFDLSKTKRVFIIGAGKAGYPMAQSTREIIGEHLKKGHVIVKEGHISKNVGAPSEVDIRPGAANSQIPKKINYFEAGHPIPDERGVTATRHVIELLTHTQEDDLVIALISGGGSALLTSPVPGVSLQDMQELTSKLLACGATINEINSLRKHLDQVKGGGLARAAAPASIVTLILSDVVGDPYDVIASGPAVPDTSTFSEAYSVLDKYGLVKQIPGSIINHLKAGKASQIPETPKPGDEIFDKVHNVIIGSNIQACMAAVRQARQESFNTLLLTTWLQGEARQAGRFLAAILRQVNDSNQPIPRPACIIAGGETTVTLSGGGKGGRNQELALSAVSDLSGLDNVSLVALASDGGDGPTDAAGAVVTQDTLSRALSQGMDPFEFLIRNDAYHFFEPLGDLLKPGPTHTNVNDLSLLFAGSN
jgi:hydroxypyruvate reductase